MVMYTGKLTSVTKDSRKYTEYAGTVNQQKIIQSNFVTIKKATFLYNAVKANDFPKVKELIQKGANPNQTCYGLTPLQFAIVINGSETIINCLLDNGGDLNFHDESSTSYKDADFLNIAKKHDNYSDELIEKLTRIQKNQSEPNKYFCTIL